MSFTLQQLSGTRSGRREVLSNGQTFRVGRTEWADYSVPDDPQISSVHFELRWDNGRATLRDLNSSNGTRVNGQLITEQVLASGDVILAGKTEFVVEFSAAKATAIPPNAESPDTKSTAVNPTRATVTMTETVQLSTPISRSRPVIDDSRRPYSMGVADPEPKVRRTALHAAAWSRQPWLLDYCRRASAEPHPALEAELWLFCVLATPSDLAHVLPLIRATVLGDKRFELLGVYGHPKVLPELLRTMHTADPRAMIAAGKAFQRITGVDIESTEQVVLEPESRNREEGDDDDFVFVDPVPQPDVQRAVQYWQSSREALVQKTRLRHGVDVSRFPPDEVLLHLDLASRHEICLRGNYEGVWAGGPRTGLRFLIPRK